MNDLSIAVARVQAARAAYYASREALVATHTEKPKSAAQGDCPPSPPAAPVVASSAPTRDAGERPQRDLGVGYAPNEPLPGEDPASVPQIEETSREPGFLSVTQLTALLMAKGR